MLFATTQSSAAPAASFGFLTGPRYDTPDALPADARRAMARLTRDGHLGPDPRGTARQAYHVPAHLTRAGGAESATVYTRDASAWSVGFIGSLDLMVGAKVSLRLLMPDGHRGTAAARVRRCRPFAAGWFEVHAEFCLPQYPFETA